MNKEFTEKEIQTDGKLTTFKMHIPFHSAIPLIGISLANIIIQGRQECLLHYYL